MPIPPAEGEGTSKVMLVSNRRLINPKIWVIQGQQDPIEIPLLRGLSSHIEY